MNDTATTTTIAAATSAAATGAEGSGKGPAVTAAPVASRTKRADGLSFRNKSKRAAHVAAFLAWLPADLRAAPGIDWEPVPSRVIGYLLNGNADGPDRDAIILATGCAFGNRASSAYARCINVTALLRRLRDEFDLRDQDELRRPAIWRRFVGERQLSPYESRCLFDYDCLTNKEVLRWLDALDPAERAAWLPRTLPCAPAGLLPRLNQSRRIFIEGREQRKARTDVLVPLFPLFVALAQLRKQAMQRLVERFRVERRRVEAGEVALPHRFTMQETLRVVAEDAATLADAHFVERTVPLQFILWDRRSWVLAHPERYSKSTLRYAQQETAGRSFDKDAQRHFHLQYEGPAEDLLWFGDVIARNLLHDLADRESPFAVSRRGLLQPSTHQSRFLLYGQRPGEMLFDPECLYRGVLYGAALAMAALTSAARAGELLQFAVTRYKVELVPEFDAHLRKTGNRIPCVFQHLLPKGSTEEAERQLFLVTPEVAELLEEIVTGLEAKYGEVPLVETVNSARAEDLTAARCIFQWAASGDGQNGLLYEGDIVSLLRFLYHGLPLYTADGERIALVTQLLRHLSATHARHYQRVPVEIVAHLLLHHKLVLAGRAGAERYAAPAITEYYTRMPMQEQLGLLYTLQERHRITPDDIVVMPEASDLDAMEAHLRRVFEQWGAIAPVTFGACGSPGLCVRPDNRNHCLGCGFLVPDWRRAANLAPHREIIGRVLARAEEQGLRTEARQARENLAQLDGLAAVMRAQRLAWEDRRELPVVERVMGPVAGGEVAGE